MQKQTRLFTLTYDCSKLQINPCEQQKQRECEGTLYKNGLVTLDNGQAYNTVEELNHILATNGTYKLTYQDEQVSI